MSTATASLDAFRYVFADANELPYCIGTVALDATTSTLFYQSGDLKAELIDFAHATDAQLETLAYACQPATFGVDKKDVLDESYRKAGKMDAAKFATRFSPLELGIVDTIRESLLQGRNTEMSVRVELYKLNVYGPGAFFKSHVDTPRSDTMFGSLVVILPTKHEGGSLVFRHRGQEWTFDSAKAVSEEATPHAAFVAFYSDVEHEVLEVTSGHRVTLTYNLYFADSAATSVPSVISATDVDAQMKFALSTLLKDPSFLPRGGLLGFGLSHKYPFKPGSTDLSELAKCLKGSDAAIKRVCHALSLGPSLKSLYHERDDAASVAVLLPEFAEFGTEQVDLEEYDGLIGYLKDDLGLVVYDYGSEKPEEYPDAKPIVWIKPLSESNSFKSAYVRYGNEATLEYAYGEVCLVVNVPSAKDRKV